MNRKYPWSKLVKPNDHFLWKDRRDEKSLRVQAVKQGHRRSVEYRVSVHDHRDGGSRRRFAGFIVTYVRGIL